MYYYTISESLLKENKRLKSVVYCMICKKNFVDTLFLPCAEVEVCMTCASPLDKCPKCHKQIKQKIRVYMS